MFGFYLVALDTTDPASVVSWTLSAFRSSPTPFLSPFSFKANPLLIPEESRPQRRRSRLPGRQSSPSQLFLPHLPLYCLSHTASHHLKCVSSVTTLPGTRGDEGDRWAGSLTLLAVTIHPWMDLTVHLSHVQSLALETGNRRKRSRRRRGSKDLSGVSVTVDLLVYTESKVDHLSILTFNNPHSES